MWHGWDVTRVALVTGVGRLRGIAAAVVRALATDGWDVAGVYLAGYDRRMPWGADDECQSTLQHELDGMGRRYLPIELDLADPAAPVEAFDRAETELGPVGALVVVHTESVTSGLLDTTVESLDRHHAVNVRATWQLIKTFGERYAGETGTGRIVTFTSDHAVGNVAYGATKASADRITDAAAHELGPKGITANAVNPGAVDTGWMDDDLRDQIRDRTPLGRLGTPEDAANLVRFLCSPEGGWINGQLLYSNGGFRSTLG